MWFDDIELTQEENLITQENHYDAFGLALSGIEKVGTPENDFKYNGKELVDDLNLNWNDYGARNYDAQLGRFHSIDPSADYYHPVTPYNYVGNNPLNVTDPNGKDWSIEVDFEKKTVKITFTGKLVDETGKERKKGELQGYADRINNSIQSSFSGKTSNGFTISVTSNVTVAENGEKDLKETDHAFRIVNDGEVPGTEDGKGYGYSEVGGKFVYLNDKILGNTPAQEGKYAGTGLDANGNATLERTASHEGGHTAGLFHPGNRLMEQGDFRLQGTTHYIPGNEFKSPNLMYQSSMGGQPDSRAGSDLMDKQRSSVVKRIYDTQKGNADSGSIANFPVNNGSQKYKR